ncbi:MAG: hypothetical protein AB8B56_03495 [Crocinitomicaceae bacterium]
MKQFQALAFSTRVILVVQMIAMLMGTSTHVMWAVENGFLSTRYNAPLFSMVFWDSLTFLDPLAAILLLIRPKTGLILTLIIILADVTHNNIFYFEELYMSGISLSDWLMKYWMILGQIVFALFAILTFRKCWNDQVIVSKN